MAVELHWEDGALIPIEDQLLLPAKVPEPFEPAAPGEETARVIRDGAGLRIEPGEDPPYVNGVLLEAPRPLEHGDQVLVLGGKGARLEVKDAAVIAARERAHAERRARLEELGRIADTGELPLSYSVDYEGPASGGEKQRGVLIAGGGRLRLVGPSGALFEAALGGVDRIETPRMSGSRIDLEVTGGEYRIWLKDFAPIAGSSTSEEEAGPDFFTDSDEAIADAWGAGDAFDALEVGAGAVGKVVDSLGGRALRKAWKAVIEGELVPEEVAAERMRALIKYEEEVDAIYAEEGVNRFE